MHCEPPRLLKVTWVYEEGPHSEVELRLSPGQDGETVLELEHAPVARVIEIDRQQVDPILNDAETGTWGMGTGWEMGPIALDMFLRGRMPTGYDAESFGARPEVSQLADSRGQAWAAVVKAASSGPSAGETK